MRRPTRPDPEPGIPRTRLPVVLTRFVGRQQEIAAIRRLLDLSRLVTLTGGAGCGKTRLALRAADERRGRYADGVYWVELAPLTDPELVVQSVAGAVQVAEQPGLTTLEGVIEALRGKHLLLVLDNCEHLLAACSSVVRTLLTETDITLMATSREPLGVAGERLFPVFPMTLPAHPLSMDEATSFDAVQLFIERAQGILPHFALTPDNIVTVVRICRQLDGIPLAIELASAQVNVLTVEQIAARLDARFAGTVTAPHMTTSPHRTMRAALDWSHDLLTASEQAVLRRLSAFPGSCTLDVAEAVCAGDGIEPEQVLGVLASLVRKSLVVADTSSGPEARYDLLDLVRQYAQERLREAGEWAVTCDRMLEITVHLAEEAAPHLLGPHQGRWFSQLEAGMDTLRAALAWALEQGHIASGVRIAVALFQFWDRRWHTREGFGWFARLIPHFDETLPLDLRVAALTYASYLAMFLVDAPAASAWSRRALALCEAAGDDGLPLIGLALSGAVGAARVAGEPETAYRISAQILERDRAMPDNLIYGMQLYIHGYLAAALGHYADAHAALDEARQYARAGSDPYRMAIILQTEGDLARCEGQHQQAVRHYEDSLTLLQELSASGRDVADTERGLAFAWLRLGDLQRAHALFAHSLDGQQAQDNRLGMAQALQGMAALAVATGNLHAAARLDGFVAAYRADVPILLEPADAADQLDFTSFSASLRGQLSEASTEAEQAAGRRMTLPQAVTYALSLPLPAQSETVLDALTPREREITALIARGLSNGDIADALFLSKRTVEKHIAHILSKLGLANRVQVVRWAADHDLTGS